MPANLLLDRKASLAGTFVWEKGALQVPRLPSDFLSSLVTSVNLMRLSLNKAAYVVVFKSSVVGNPEFAPNEQKINPIESISIFSVHFTLNLPQASRLLGMTKGRAVTFIRSR
jgi:hypothetical protein